MSIQVRNCLLVGFILLSGMLFVTTAIDAKPAVLTADDVTEKAHEIMKSHASYKKFTPLLAKRTISNFIDDLDPGKSYFLESEVNPWLNLGDKELEAVVSDFENSKFQVFQQIYDLDKKAILRRRQLEERLDKDVLPENVSAKDFKDLTFATTEEELYERLKKLRALQIEVASKIGKEGKATVLQRLKKRREKMESEILTSNKKLESEMLCTDVLKSIASSLDAHTNYFTPSEAEQFLISVQQRLFGIGVQLRDDFDGFTVVKIVEGGPADTAKELKAKDKIIAINGEPVMGMDITDVVDLIRGPEGSTVQLKIVRPVPDGAKAPPDTIDVTITRGQVVLKETRLDSQAIPFGKGVIAYLRLYAFYQDSDSSSAEDLRKAFEAIAKEDKVLGVVLDLRFNAGGVLTQAVAVTGLFIDKGIVVSIKDENSEVHHLRDLDTAKMWSGPLVVLINRASASAAEIVAGTLQDYGRAIICGDDHSFGKGSFQTFTLTPTPSGAVDPKGEYKVTRGRYYTVSGSSPQLIGVKSDIIVPSGLSSLEVGEEHSKYPLDSDSIDPGYEDSLADVSFFQRERIKRIYAKEGQARMTEYTQLIEELKKNSEKRVSNNKMYQTLLEGIKKGDMDLEEIGIVDRYPDFQLYEGMNIMRDLLIFSEENQEKKAA